MDALLISFLAGSFVALSAVFLFGWYILQAIAYWKIFKKAGIPGWKSLIPFYNVHQEFKICWKTKVFWVWFVCIIASGVISGLEESLGGGASILGGACQLVAFVISIMENRKLAKAFGHGIGFTIGLIILEPIFQLILGFDSSEYLGPQE